MTETVVGLLLLAGAAGGLIGTVREWRKRYFWRGAPLFFIAAACLILGLSYLSRP